MTEHRAHLTQALLKTLFGVDATPEQVDQILLAAQEDSSRMYYEDLDADEEARKAEMEKLLKDDPYAATPLIYIEGDDEPEPDEWD